MTFVEAKMCAFTLEYKHFIFKRVPFTLTTVQVPNLALTHTKRITVWLDYVHTADPLLEKFTPTL